MVIVFALMGYELTPSICVAESGLGLRIAAQHL